MARLPAREKRGTGDEARGYPSLTTRTTTDCTYTYTFMLFQLFRSMQSIKE